MGWRRDKEGKDSKRSSKKKKGGEKQRTAAAAKAADPANLEVLCQDL